MIETLYAERITTQVINKTNRIRSKIKLLVKDLIKSDIEYINDFRIFNNNQNDNNTTDILGNGIQDKKEQDGTYLT